MKKLFRFILVVLLCPTIIFAESRIACGDAGNIPLALPEFVRTILTLVKFLVPLGLILYGGVDLLKAVYSNDKRGLDIATKHFITRAVAGVSIFFFIYIVQIFVKGTEDNTVLECLNCFTTDENACVVYNVEVDDGKKEKEEADKKREALNKKREEERKKQEEEARRAREIASRDKDDDSILNGTRTPGETTGSCNPGSKNIFLGDSRTVQMCIYKTGASWVNTPCEYTTHGTYQKGNDYYVAAGGLGYDWMVSSGAAGVNAILNANPGTTFNIISLLGINGLGAERYVAKYKEYASGPWKGHNLVFVSGNPIDESRYYGFKNSDIESFNRTLKNGISGIGTYCDTYSKLSKNFGGDGLHYNQQMYEKIYTESLKCANKIDPNCNNGVSGETHSAGLNHSQKLQKVFPNGIPTSDAEVRKYLVDLEVPITKKDGTKTTTTVQVHKVIAGDVKAALVAAQNSGFKVYEIGGYRTYGSDSAGSITSIGLVQSQHCYGLAVDINVDENCYRPSNGSCVVGSTYLTGPYAITPDTALYKSFIGNGWGWGGEWSSSKDYMHFSYFGY